ncbi:hypothetical protein DRE_04423 [Drechslerella stenobrocha 248]|uniref:Uncharacterized protein n=1 Tax=Drechslerella stenobrocha 248 TaxID=1043628 RepID=W7I145_9PEZI|nr:hypothetical protein DRE_04423 [Drechslerella stenobrocha 248]
MALLKSGIIAPLGIGTVLSFAIHPLVSGSISAFFTFCPSEIQQPVLNVVNSFVSTSILNTLVRPITVAFWLGLLSRLNSYLSRRSANNWADDTYNWEEEIVLITGASSGYGERMTELLAQRGIKVITISRGPLKPRIASYKSVYWYKCDVTNFERVSQIAAQIRREHGDPTILVNNAGVLSKVLLLEQHVEDVKKMFDVNLISHWKLLQEFLPAMIRKNHGHVISIASLASFISTPGMGEYAATKHGLLALHDTLRQELKYVYKAERVRTSIINPGWTDTPMVQNTWEAALKKKGTAIMKTDEVVARIVNVILSGESCGPLPIPSYSTLAIGARMLVFP